MDALISVTGDYVSASGDLVRSQEVSALGFERLHVSLAGEARCNGDEEGGAEYRCKRCGQVIPDWAPGGNPAEMPEGAETGVNCPEYYEEDDEVPGHHPEPIPGSFANSVSAAVSEDDSVTVAISVGDPRGAFTMTVWRSSEDGRLRLSVPDPSDGFPHMALKQVRPGLFEIGN